MASKIPNQTRNSIVAAFRERICERLEVVPFVHQREWWAATEGLTLMRGVKDPNGVTVQLPDKSVETWMVAPREGGHARFIADLGAFKVGKSYGQALFAAGFGAIPGARVNLIGSEYDICEPEFSYIIEFLLSEKGMNMKATSYQNRPRDGKMFLDIEGGAQFVARSWERKDSLKGKEIDLYVYCEAYQLPGLECFTDFSQNLRVREGFATFATTPDRPWVEALHELGHGADPEWHCTCSVGAENNPYAFDAKAKIRDEKLMTREKFQIHYEGKLGDYVGRVFNYARGERQFGPGTHPMLFPRGGAGREDLSVPDGWEVIAGADTGTYYSAGIVAFSPDGEAFVLDEFPNYRYVAGEAERDESLTIPEWARWVTDAAQRYHARGGYLADKNSQFKKELANYGMALIPSTHPLETRTEITREYFEHKRIWFAPWLEILPFEIENAEWPEEATLAGKFQRLKKKDHTLDWLEHILSRRPRGRIGAKKRKRLWIEEFTGKSLADRRPTRTHLGSR